jgi:cytidylate kinase
MENNTTEKKNFQQFISEQIEKWAHIRSGKYQEGDVRIPTITLSSEPGSGGSLVAKGIADRLGLDIFQREIIKEIAESVEVSPNVIERIEKERMSGVADFISSLLSDKYIWPGLYLEHLTKIVTAIGRQGGAIIVGRGVNFILAPEDRLSLRVVAPFDVRVQNVVNTYGVTVEEATERIKNRQSKRKAYIKESFHADIADPLHYDFTINTARISIEDAVEAISFYWGNKHIEDIKNNS